MESVRLKRDLSLATGPTFRAGTRLWILRDYTVNRTERRLCLGYEDGRIVLPSVEPEDVEQC